MHQKLLIYTDLDGSLLDHHTYSFAEAAPLLSVLRERDIPVIPVTSKTRAELLPLKKQLQNTDPFITENGAAVFIPENYFPEMDKQSESVDGFYCYQFSEPREHWQALLLGLSQAFKGDFITFSQAGVEGIVEMTGLPKQAAELANQRDFSEPVRWLGSEQAKQQFIAELQAQGATVLQGGRFLHITGGCDKGKALKWLTQRYQSHYPQNNFVTLAVGDSHNDISMLEAVNKPVIVRSPVQDVPVISRPDVYITEHYGPAGWVEAVKYLAAPLLEPALASESLNGNE